ncbi:hypothetical protein FA15DRAFT_660312 [Coprinopsis marcescibilis]|uniref:Uncharacterized protein n=1 Tax=Coprinopsis marcescibilis TaxID=230819 RepID=A0A5C3KGW2_COPMA|nr:hypothetical protein FA15DRAFT_660312 [Coprinopsis marcescibilis]
MLLPEDAQKSPSTKKSIRRWTSVSIVVMDRSVCHFFHVRVDNGLIVRNAGYSMRDHILEDKREWTSNDERKHRPLLALPISRPEKWLFYGKIRLGDRHTGPGEGSHVPAGGQHLKAPTFRKISPQSHESSVAIIDSHAPAIVIDHWGMLMGFVDLYGEPTPREKFQEQERCCVGLIRAYRQLNVPVTQSNWSSRIKYRRTAGRTSAPGSQQKAMLRRVYALHAVLIATQRFSRIEGDWVRSEGIDDYLRPVIVK